MRRLYKGQKNTLYKISKLTGVSISTLYNYLNGRTKISAMPFWLVVAIADIEEINAGTLYEEMLKEHKEV